MLITAIYRSASNQASIGCQDFHPAFHWGNRGLPSIPQEEEERETLTIIKAGNNGIAILYLKGHLDLRTARQLEKALEELMDVRRYDVIIDCNELDHIDSAGPGVLIDFVEVIRRHGGDIKLTNMNAKVYGVFELLGFPALFDIRADNSAALEKFEERRHETWWHRMANLTTWMNRSDLFPQRAEKTPGRNIRPAGKYQDAWCNPTPA